MIQHTDAQFDETLTKRAIALLEGREDFAVVNGAIPMIPTEVFNGNYKVWSASDFRRRNIEKRAQGTEFKRVNIGVAEKSFKCEQEGYEIPIPDRNRLANEAEDTSLKMVEDAYAQFDIRLAEKLVSGNFSKVKTGVASSPSTNQFIKWNQAGSNPIADIKAMKLEIKHALGVNPDSLLITEDIYNALTENATILARLRTDADKDINAQKLAQFFGLKNVYIMAGCKTTTEDGQATQTIGTIATAGTALLYYKGDVAGATTPSTIKCFYNTNTYGAGSNGIIIQTYREEKITSDIIRVVQDFTVVVSMEEGGVLLTSVL